MNEWLVPADCSTQTLEDWLQCSQFPVVAQFRIATDRAVIFTAPIFLQFDYSGGYRPTQQLDWGNPFNASLLYQTCTAASSSTWYIVFFYFHWVSPTRCCTNSSKTALSKIIETMLHRRPIMRDLKSYLHLQSICIVCNALSMKCWRFNYKTGSFYPLQHNILVTILVDPMEVLLNGIWSCFTGGTLQLGCIGCNSLK